MIDMKASRAIGFIICCLFALTVLLQPSYADDSQKVKTWIKSISVKLKLVSGTKNKKTGVAGVKVITPSDVMKNKEQPSVTAGTKGEPTAKDETLYYKDFKVSDQEVKLLEDAVRLAEMGDSDAAVSRLEDFLKKHPNSALANDAKEGLKALKEKGK